MKRRLEDRVQRMEEGNSLYEIDLDCIEKRQKAREALQNQEKKLPAAGQE